MVEHTQPEPPRAHDLGQGARVLRAGQLLSGLGLLLLIVHHVDVYPALFAGAVRIVEGGRIDGGVAAKQWGGEGEALPPMALEVRKVDPALGDGASGRAVVRLSGALGAGEADLREGVAQIAGNYRLTLVGAGMAPEFVIRDRSTAAQWSDYAYVDLQGPQAPMQPLELRGLPFLLQARLHLSAELGPQASLGLVLAVEAVEKGGAPARIAASETLRVGDSVTIGEHVLELARYRPWATLSVIERRRPLFLWAGLAFLIVGLLTPAVVRQVRKRAFTPASGQAVEP